MFAMAFDTLPEELLCMILLYLDNRDDRTVWRLICRFTNNSYLKERCSRRKGYSERHKVDIQSSKAILFTSADFRCWTSICYRSNEDAFLAARLLWKNLDGSSRAPKQIGLRGELESAEQHSNHGQSQHDGYEDIDGNIKQHKVETARRTLVDTLRDYLGDRSFETHLRGLVSTKRQLERHDMTWAHALFYSWIHSHPMHDMSTISIALLLMERYHYDGRFDNDAVRRMQALFGEHKFRGFFHDCLSGGNEKIYAAFQIVALLHEPDQWLIQEGITILQYRGYSAGVWKNRFSAHHCHVDAAFMLEKELQNIPRLPAGQDKVDPLVVLDAIEAPSLAAQDVIDLFSKPLKEAHISPRSPFSNHTIRKILRAQQLTGDQNNLLLPQERMKFLGMVCDLLSKVYHDLMIKATYGSPSTKQREYLEAAQEQKRQLDMYLAEWRAIVDQKGYPNSWRDLLASTCDHTEKRPHESWGCGHGVQRKLGTIMTTLRDAKKKAYGELHKQKQLAGEMWNITPVGSSSDVHRSWQMEWAEISFDRLQANLRVVVGPGAII
jgi:hypothetical protein